MPDPKLEDLIEAGLLISGSSLFKIDTSEELGVVNSEGKIEIQKNGELRTFEYPSGAARWLEGRSINGWIYWGVDVEGELMSLKQLRDKL